ncbi:MAG: cyclase family protein [Bacillota bacterium]
MRIYDISMQIHSGMQVYKNNTGKKPVLEAIRDFSTGDVYESRLSLDLHTGTHIDAPLHMIKDGGTIDNIDLNKVVTKCKIFDLTSITGAVGEHDLTGLDIREGDFVIIKTANSFSSGFKNDFTYLAESGARYLADKKITGVGIDSLGIERSQAGHPTHKILLEAGVVILEGLRLSGVAKGEYILIALPLKIKGAEASPARAILLDSLS